MSAATLPLVAADIEGTGLPFYAAAWDSSADDETNVIWLGRPVLIEGHHWATEEQVRSPHITLDMTTVAELIAHDLTADPDTLSDDEIVAMVDAQLIAVHCDMGRCCIEVFADQADHYDGGNRVARCLLRAGQACGVKL